MKTSSTPRPCYRGLCSLLLCIAALWIMPTGSSAQTPITVVGPALRRVDIYSNNLGIHSGDRIAISADSVTPNGANGTTATAQTTNLSGQPVPSPTPLVIPWNPTTVGPNEFRGSIPYDPNLIGQWTMTFTNAATSPPTTTATTPTLVGVNGVPYVIISGSTLNPTFTWSFPTSVDGVTFEVLSALVRVGAFPLTLALTPDGSSAYVANSEAHSVSVINTGTNTVTATVQVGFDPVDVAIAPNRATAYIADALADSLTVLNTATNQVVTNLPVGFLPVKTAITPNGATAYVADAGGKSVSVINTANNTVVATIGVGADPVNVSISPDGVHAYVTNAGSNSVSVIDTSTNAVSATVPVGVLPVNAGIF